MSALQILSMIGAVGSLVGAVLMVTVVVLQWQTNRRQRAQQDVIDRTLAALAETQTVIDRFLAERRGTS